MNRTITITSKGQTTLPAAMRHKLGIAASGGVLQISFNDRKGEMVISKPATVAEVSRRASSYLKPGIKPLTDVDAYYQAQRKAQG